MTDNAGSRPTRAARPPRESKIAAAPPPRSQVDRALAGIGVLIALSSLGFAGYMVSDIDRPTRIAGMEYLAIFARPSHALSTPDERVGALAALGTREPSAQAIDPTPTGSISDAFVAGRAANGAPSSMAAGDLRSARSPFRLLYVSDGEGLLQTDVGILHVKAGDMVPQLGRIDSIEKIGERWVLLSQNGAALEWPGRPATDAGASPRSKPGAP